METLGRISGGGFLIFWIISGAKIKKQICLFVLPEGFFIPRASPVSTNQTSSWSSFDSLTFGLMLALGTAIETRLLPSGDNESIQYGSPRTTTSCIMMPKEYTSPIWVPYLGNPFVLRSASGAVHNNSVGAKWALNHRQVESTIMPHLWPTWAAVALRWCRKSSPCRSRLS